MFNIEMLPANEGDALWIEYGPDHGPVHRVLIDCGRKKAYREVRARLDAAAAQGRELDFDLFVLTHVDADHIGLSFDETSTADDVAALLAALLPWLERSAIKTGRPSSSNPPSSASKAPGSII